MLFPESFVSSVLFCEVNCLPSFFFVGTYTELLDPVEMKLFDWLELQLELWLKKEDQHHTSSGCVDCMLGKIVVKASFLLAAHRKCHCMQFLFSRKKRALWSVTLAWMFSNVSVSIRSVGDIQHSISHKLPIWSRRYKCNNTKQTLLVPFLCIVLHSCHVLHRCRILNSADVISLVLGVCRVSNCVQLCLFGLEFIL